MSSDPITALPSRPSPGAAGAHLGELYAAHARMVYGICRMLLRDPNEAEDATQQVFLAAYGSLLTGTEVRDPAAWLGTIARNACRRRATARMREPLAVDDEPTLVSPAADETAIGREQAAALYAELAGLPEKQREAVVLRDLYGLRYDEVATALGTSRPAVEALLFRGRRRLQRRLRPGVAAGVLVVPLAVQESIAYAVPGFASTAVPTGAVAVAAGIPLVAKLAAGGAAVGLAGSAGIVAERSLHDPTVRPAETKVEQVVPAVTADGARPAAPGLLLPIPPGGFPVVRATGDEDRANSGPGRGDEDERAGGAAGDDEGDEDESDDDRGEDRADDADGGEDERDEREDRSGHGGGDEHNDVADPADVDHSGPGGGDDSEDDSEDDHSGESGNSGKGGGGHDEDAGSGEGSG